ncbi:hypothetical protein AB0H73_10130 [Streptomyces olivoreticuli]
MSRTWHHRRFLRATKGNPARALGTDDRAAARKGILVTSVRADDGWPEYTRSTHMWADPGVRKALQNAVHRRERATARLALRTGTKDLRRTATKLLTTRAQALPAHAETPRAERRRIDWDMS